MSKFNDKIISANNKNSHKRNITALALPQKYAHIDFTPPKGVIEAAARGLEVRQSKPASQRGGTAVGVARARDLKNGRTMTPDTIKRMYSYFSRHEVDKKAEGWDTWSKGKQSWWLWGGDPGFTWAKKIVEQMNRADEAITALSEQDRPQLTKASPISVLSLGQNFSRFTGKPVGSEITKEILRELVRMFKEREDAVIIDWEHASSSFVQTTPAPPEVGKALGEVVDVYLDENEENLYIIPEYTKAGLGIIQQSEGVLWPSPEFAVGDIFSKRDGKKLGNAALLAVTLTPRPQQSQEKIQRVLLSENVNSLQEKAMDPKQLEGKSPEELIALIVEKHDLVLNLEKKVEEMKAAYDQLKADHEAMMLEMEGGSMSEQNTPVNPEAQAMGEYKKSEMNAMSEKIAQELNAQIVAMSEQIAFLKKANHEVEKKAAVDALLHSGKITPSEVAIAQQAFDAKNTTPAFWNLFSERKPSAAVPLQAVGHSASGSEVSLLSEAKSLQAQKKITFAQAIAEIRSTRPDVYTAYYDKI